MAEIDKKTIKYLTELSRIRCSEEEQAALLQDLKKILSYIEQLAELDTTQTPACNHVLEDVVNVMRADEIGETLPRDTALAIAPAKVSGLYRIPTVIKTPA